MANCVALNTFGATNSVDTASTGGAGSFTVGLNSLYSDHRAMLHVYNGDAATLRVNVDKGDAFRSDLGDLNVDIKQGQVADIPLNDSGRFKVSTTNSVTVNLNDTADTTASAAALAAAVIWVSQG